MLCDLHVHSNCSDGKLSPEGLIAHARELAIPVIALCDHNTVAGLERFTQASVGSGVTAVPGVEITAADKGREVHILGLFLPSSAYTALTVYLEQINLRKEASNRTLAERLRAGGYAIDYDHIKQVATAAMPNRLHFANALVDGGYVATTDEAFDTILSENGPFYIPPDKLEATEVIATLSALGALPVMAHPFLNLSYDELCIFLPKAKSCGLVAMETLYTLYSDEESRMADELAMCYGLLRSGGSDYHGENKPGIEMGVGKGNLRVPLDVYEDLRRVAQARR